jgi:hypothetical protein
MNKSGGDRKRKSSNKKLLFKNAKNVSTKLFIFLV